MNAALLPLLLLVACSTPPHAQEAQRSGQPDQAQQKPPAPRVRSIHIPAKPEPAPTPAPPPRADDICPPPTGRETERQAIIRKLDCLLERGR